MNSAQRHRGPDGEGYVFFFDSTNVQYLSRQDPAHALDLFSVAFGHNRLSVIDVTQAAAQPMSSCDKRFWITYNGEIYNFQQLRSELISLGHNFVSNSDTEVVLASFLEWGIKCFSRFNGMWALAIWDSHRKKLILSRDRFGIKPLHTVIHRGALYFSSEIKGLLALPDIPRSINASTVYDYLIHGVVNSSEQTFFSGITAFPPGCYAEICLHDLKIVPTKYWTLDCQQGSCFNMTFEAACDEFRNLFSSCVASHMIADVPLGSCLSGGLDSSSILAVSSKLANSRINTYTASFPESQFDESHWAKLVIDATGSKPHFIVPTESSLLADYEKLVWHQEEPFGSASLYAQWLVMREASQTGVKVILDGQGADEILCGYKKFYAFYLISLLRGHRYLDFASNIGYMALVGDRGFFKVNDALRYLSPSLKNKIFNVSDYMREHFISSDSSIRLGGCDDIRIRQSLDIESYSLPSLLRYEDRNSMAWSIESRVPFLDHRLVEFAISLPPEYKLRGGRTKALLRRSMKSLVPEKVLARRDKMGFVTPQSNWMNGRLGKHMEELCRSQESTLNNWVDTERVIREWKMGNSHQRDGLQTLLFKLGALAQWISTFKVAL